MKLSEIKTKNVANLIIKNNDKFSKLLQTNKNFINKIVYNKLKRYVGDKREIFEDLFQIGSIALWRALQNYDPSKKKNIANFSTYSYIVIKNDIVKYLEKDTKYSINQISLDNSSFKIYDENNNKEFNEAKLLMKYNNIYKSAEEVVLEKLNLENLVSSLSNMDKIILEGKNKKLTRKQIAKNVNMNFHTFKSYYYCVFLPKIEKNYV